MAKYHFTMNVRRAMSYMRRNEVGEITYVGTRPKVTMKDGSRCAIEGVEYHPITDAEMIYVRVHGSLVPFIHLDEESQNKVAKDVLNTKF